MFLLVDSDSPFVLVQLQHGCGSGCHTFISKHFYLYDMSYVLCWSASFLQHVYIQLCFLFLIYDLMFPMSFVLIPLLFLLSLSSPVGFCSPFYPGCFLIEPLDNLSDYVHPGIACLVFQDSDWVGAFWGSLSGFLISHLLLGVHPSMTLVKLMMTGYHFNCLDE